ncbi:hypothetical protein CVT26_013392 [Gymnopilus dilepis]|uniref:CFEM domain-containing protein n=1 Tax=Gymnopilus dilepis TaxID=231916 RepID=A0A409VV33_9AGAR|nr:hypothetical protein CVT26_013392 [Gymnopilus dilepis]
MRFSTVAFTLFGAAASVSASSLVARQGSLPDCAIPCTTQADLGGCVISDTHCLCTNEKFVSSTTSCIESKCTGSDLQAAIAYSQGLCLTVGVTLASSSTPATSPTAGGSNSSSSASQTSSGASSTATSPSSPAAPSPTNNAASAHGVNTLLGLSAAAGLVAFAL